ncbi:hypothetical protein EYF80_018464 [Liparis tanakae]|uniref:Uncharacterized protein n=1 Tax=Liparis tanakae TaxID=230148 RepID=A0A4Z2I208_9TELE|nr:hypothetical protein EYF80_018464 [Liparis tanakae]
MCLSSRTQLSALRSNRQQRPPPVQRLLWSSGDGVSSSGQHGREQQEEEEGQPASRYWQHLPHTHGSVTDAALLWCQILNVFAFSHVEFRMQVPVTLNTESLPSFREALIQRLA